MVEGLFTQISSVKNVELYFEYMEVVSDPVFVHDFRGNIIYVNENAARLYGYRKDEMIGNNLYDMVSKRPVIPKDIRTKALIDRGHDIIDTIDFKRDGSMVKLRVHAFVLKKNGKGIILSIAKDITDYSSIISDNDFSQTNGRYFKQIVDAMITMTGVRDPYTANHQKRVASLACAIAKEMQYNDGDLKGLYISGLLHDIGKIYVPTEILTKPGSINEYEFNIIKKHSEIGYGILSKVSFPWPVCDIVIQHHERMDGSGYPFMLKGEDIHMEARILAVADVVESMSSHRPYRPALGIEKALEEIHNGMETLYDKEVTKACTRIFEKGRFDLDTCGQDILEEMLL